MPATPAHLELDAAEIGRVYLRSLSPEALVALGAGVGGTVFLVATCALLISEVLFSLFVISTITAYCLVPPDTLWRVVGQGVVLGQLMARGVRGLREGPGSDRRPLLPGTAEPPVASATVDREEKHTEQQLLEAIERHGEVTPARAALETSLTVSEAERMLFDLANRGHLEVRVEGAKILYGLP